MRTMNDITFTDKVVLLRTDFNVPIKHGVILDDTRIRKSLATIRHLLDHDSKVVVISHLGRPKAEYSAELSLAPIADHLRKILHSNIVSFCPDTVGKSVEKFIQNSSLGSVIVLENIRFLEGEEKNDRGLAEQLAKLADVYINDAFACSHRAHASIDAITEFLPSVAGLLLQEEMAELGKIDSANRKLGVIVGGSKVSTKLDILNNLVTKAEFLVVGGGIANTFLRATGANTGRSLIEEPLLGQAKEILAKAKEYGCEIILPSEVVVCKQLKEGTNYRTIDISEIASDEMIVDIGPKSVEKISKALAGVDLVLWNGPLGVFEISPFDQGSTAVAEAIAKKTKARKLQSIAGGGDVIAAISSAGVYEEFTYISTAGGAFLEYIEGKTLPGIASLQEKRQKNAVASA